MRLYCCALLWVVVGVAAFADEPESRQGFVEVPGGPVWYRISGDGAGIPLLALHGGPGGTSCGLSLLEPLGTERPVIRYDQLGGGRSGRPDDLSLWRVERFVEALHVLRRSLGLDEVHLLGHSWGGALAAAYVLDKGTDGIRSLTLSSPLISTPLWVEDARLLREQLPVEVRTVLDRHEAAGTIDSPEYAAASEVFYERHVYGGARPAPPAACHGADGNPVVYNYMWGPTEFNATGTLIDFDLSERLHEIDIPVLFIAGRFDEARPERLATFRERIPGARLEVIEDAAHASLSRKPDEYRRILAAFLNAVEAGRR